MTTDDTDFTDGENPLRPARDAIPGSEVQPEPLPLDEPIEEEVEEAWDKEIARRVASILDGTEPGRPAEEVFAEIWSQLNQPK